MNITQNAITSINKDSQLCVEADARQIINRISGYQISIKQSEEAVKLAQESNAKLSINLITYERVTGMAAPFAPNENQVTILRTIAELNNSNQKTVEAQSRYHISTITQNTANIKAMCEEIENLRKDLAKLSVNLITESQVTGN